MIDRIVHHADVITLKSTSYRQEHQHQHHQPDNIQNTAG